MGGGRLADRIEQTVQEREDRLVSSHICGRREPKRLRGDCLIVVADAAERAGQGLPLRLPPRAGEVPPDAVGEGALGIPPDGGGQLLHDRAIRRVSGPLEGAGDLLGHPPDLLHRHAAHRGQRAAQ
ncbi:MAG: hypothetical protein HYT90_01680 [Candidatus Omnitrophica bacterium]|nr:hypothetical protein [Candidatus Omnitrophota bacterium]